MSKLKRTTVEEVRRIAKRYAHVLKDDGFKVKKVFLYGSFARGTNRADSDIDLAIISSSFAVHREEKEKLLWHHVLKVDSRIEPVAYTPEEFDPIDPLVWEIQQEGIKIDV